jgi:translation elongation factor EF-Ts
MHIAAMKPAYLKLEEIPERVKQEILDGENGEKALKKYIKRDVLWQQELATAEKAETVGRFLAARAKALKTEINIDNWALFVIE